MIKKTVSYDYSKKRLETRVKVNFLGINIYNRITVSNCPCDLEAVERKPKENNYGKVGFKS